MNVLMPPNVTTPCELLGYCVQNGFVTSKRGVTEG